MHKCSFCVTMHIYPDTWVTMRYRYHENKYPAVLPHWFFSTALESIHISHLRPMVNFFSECVGGCSRGWTHQFYLPELRRFVQPVQAAAADPGQRRGAGRSVGPETHHQPGPGLRDADSLHHQSHGGRGHSRRSSSHSVLMLCWFSYLWSQRFCFHV